MAISRLDDRHKRAVELVLRGAQKSDIINELGIARTTLHGWMQDPLWQGLYASRAQELENETRDALIVPWLKGVELLEYALDQALEQMKSTDPAERVKAPSLATVTKSMEQLQNMLLKSRGHAHRITEVRINADGEAATKQTPKYGEILAAMREHAMIDVEIVHDEDRGPRRLESGPSAESPSQDE